MKEQRNWIGVILINLIGLFALVFVVCLIMPHVPEQVVKALPGRNPFSISLNAARVPPYIASFSNVYYTAPVGHKILICNVTMVYNGRDQGLIKCRHNDFIMQDNKGESYQSASVGLRKLVKDVQLLDVDLSLGATMRGDVVFVVPQNVEAKHVVYEPQQKAAERLF